MAIQSGATNRGLIRERAVSASDTGIRWRSIPPLVKFATILLFSLVLLVMSLFSVARTQVIPEINVLAGIYLPGNSLPLLPQDSECNPVEDDNVSCLVRELGQDVYLIYGKSSRMIVRTAVRGREHKIGDLITAWGFPTGIAQHDTFTFVNWGRRSAIIYSMSFKPESRVAFIQYDLEEQPTSPWRGFKPFGKSD